MIDLYTIEPIELKRIKLRMIDPKDADGIFAIRSNLDMIRYTRISQMKNMDEAITYVKTRREGMKENKWIYMAITSMHTDDLMGTICIFNFSDDKTSADIGYELLPAYQGNGYVHEAVTALMQFAYETLGIHILTADIHEDNLPSINVVKRAGFKFTKELDNGYKLFSANSASASIPLD